MITKISNQNPTFKAGIVVQGKSPYLIKVVNHIQGKFMNEKNIPLIPNFISSPETDYYHFEFPNQINQQAKNFTETIQELVTKNKLQNIEVEYLEI